MTEAVPASGRAEMACQLNQMEVMMRIDWKAMSALAGSLVLSAAVANAAPVLNVKPSPNASSNFVDLVGKGGGGGGGAGGGGRGDGGGGGAMVRSGGDGGG